jgi:hypothetical protein
MGFPRHHAVGIDGEARGKALSCQQSRGGAKTAEEEETTMPSCALRWFPVCTITGLLLVGLGSTAVISARASDPEIDRLLRSPVGKDWITNGGNLTNQRYSTLKQINTSNVGQLKGAWMTRLKGSGLGGKYSLEASPLVKDGIMYVVTGNDDVFAINAKTGEILWEYWSGIEQRSRQDGVEGPAREMGERLRHHERAALL